MTGAVYSNNGLIALLERVLDWYGDGEDLGDNWQETERLMADIAKAVGRDSILDEQDES